MVSSFLYLLPFGGSGPARHIIGGWQISGILQLRSGQAYTPGLRTDVSNTTVRADRPNVIGDTHASNPHFSPITDEGRFRVKEWVAGRVLDPGMDYAEEFVGFDSHEDDHFRVRNGVT